MTINGKAMGLTSRTGTPQCRRNGGACPSPLHGDEVLTNTAGTSRQQFEAARREIDALVKLNTRLREESALLVESLANARRFAYHDELTGLPNRRLLHDHFNVAVARAKRQHGMAPGRKRTNHYGISAGLQGASTNVDFLQCHSLGESRT